MLNFEKVAWLHLTAIDHSSAKCLISLTRQLLLLYIAIMQKGQAAIQIIVTNFFQRT